MGLVHGTDFYTYMTVGPKITDTDDPAYPGTQERVPLVGENMKLERETEIQVEEITAAGAVTTLELGKHVWRGTFTTLIYYNARWFHWFLCQLMGGVEVRRADYLVSGEIAPVAPVTNSHWYIPQSYRCTTTGSVGAIPYGLVARLSKQGTNNTNAYVEKLGNAGAGQGLRITGVTFDFPADGWPTATWEVLGPKPVLLGPSSFTPITQSTTDYPVRPQDNSRDSTHTYLPSIFQGEVFSTWTDIDWRRFSLSIRRPLETPPFFANDWEGANYAYNMGLTGKLEVTAQYETMMTGGSAEIARYNVEWLAEQQIGDNQRRMRWISAAEADAHSSLTPQADPTESIPYAFQINAPNVIITEAQEPVESGGAINMRWSERWISRRTTSTAGAGYPWDDDATDTYTAPVVLSCQVADGDEPSTPFYFSVPGAGGNAPFTDITG